MVDERKEDEVVLEEEQDELDNWFEEDEDEDQSAEEDAEYEEESSPSEDEEEPEPDDEDQSEDAAVAASDEGTSAKARSEENPYAWMEELDSDLKAKVERLVQSDRSNKGRVAALQRQLDSVRSQQDAREKTQSSAAAQQVAAANGKNLEDMNDEELAEFMEEFPSVARNVQKLIDQRVRDEMARRVQPLEEARIQQKLEQDRYILRQEAQRIFNTVETGIDLDDVTSSRAFTQWLAEQSQEYQNFARNAESVKAASEVLEDFALYMEDRVAHMLAEEGTAAEQATTQDRSRSADATAARRREARQGATPKSKSAQLTNKPGQGTYEDWFDHFASGGN